MKPCQENNNAAIYMMLKGPFLRLHSVEYKLTRTFLSVTCSCSNAFQNLLWSVHGHWVKLLTKTYNKEVSQSSYPLPFISYGIQWQMYEL